MASLRPRTLWRPGYYISARSPFYFSAILLPAICLFLLLPGCSEIPVLDNLNNGHYTFSTETGDSVSFPESFAGKILVVSYIYTHCPDICIATTSNLDSLRRLANGRNNVLFLSVSIDPRRD